MDSQDPIAVGAPKSRNRISSGVLFLVLKIYIIIGYISMRFYCYTLLLIYVSHKYLIHIGTSVRFKEDKVWKERSKPCFPRYLQIFPTPPLLISVGGNGIVILTTIKPSQSSSFSEQVLYFIHSSYVVFKLSCMNARHLNRQPRVVVDILSVKLFNQINIIYKF